MRPLMMVRSWPPEMEGVALIMFSVLWGERGNPHKSAVWRAVSARASSRLMTCRELSLTRLRCPGNWLREGPRLPGWIGMGKGAGDARMEGVPLDIVWVRRRDAP